MIAPPKPPTHDELEALIKEARARQLRRRLLGAAAVAIVAALGLGLYAFLSASSPDSTTGNSPNRSANAPLCRSTQLSAQADFNHAGGQPGIFGGVMIYQKSSSNCSLPRRTPVALISSVSRQVAIRQFANTPFMRSLNDRTTVPLIAHGAFAEVYLLWSNWCAKPATALTLRFAPNVQVTARPRTQPGCTHPTYRSSLVVSRTLRRS
jgi:hypothetical protein